MIDRIVGDITGIGLSGMVKIVQVGIKVITVIAAVRDRIIDTAVTDRKKSLMNFSEGGRPAVGSDNVHDLGFQTGFAVHNEILSEVVGLYYNITKNIGL